MDTCLRRLRQELLSMKEAGDGLHAQMNSMMGALQELKLLQVQTALEQLEISGRSRAASRPVPELSVPDPEEKQCKLPKDSRSQEKQGQSQNPRRRYSANLPSMSSMENTSTALTTGLSGCITPQMEYCNPNRSLPFTDQHPEGQHLTQPSPPDLSGILHSLAREGPSLDSDYTEDSFDESSDWTSTLMSRSRNRQPLVLGDNVLADLVGNWLDLPDLEKEGEFGLCGSDCSTCPLHLSQPQELTKRFSLTGNIFKKFLRSVRPDREKLLKEKPGWMPHVNNSETDLLKRPKKAAKPKYSFYLPFWAGPQRAKASPFPQPPDEKNHFIELYIDRKLGEPVENVQPLFDYNTAVWV